MTKKELIEYRIIVKEIEEAEYKLKQDYSHDKVAGSDSQFPYTKRTFAVSGLEVNQNNDDRLSQLNTLREQKKKVEQFVDNIPDRITQRAFRIKYIHGDFKKSWEEVADEIGGGNTAESARKIVTRYLKKHVK